MHDGGFTRGYGVQHWHSIDTLNSGPVAPQASPSTSNLSAGYWYTMVIMVLERVAVTKLWLACASTTTGGTVELGLYDSANAKLVSGSASHPGSVTELVIDVTDTDIDPGWYRLAALATTANAGIYRVPGGAVVGEASGSQYGGSGSETSLPATLTFVGATDGLFVGGILTNTVVT